MLNTKNKQIKRNNLFILSYGLLGLFVYLGMGLLTPVKAASLTNISDTISTSRPSSASPIAYDQTNTSTQSASVIDNGSIYLSSDAAQLRPDTGEIANNVTVASMSALQSGSPNTRLIYFTSAITHTHHKGDVLVVPITAMHTVQFQIINQVPTNGRVLINFPPLSSTDANTPASPSASTFQLNSLTSYKIFDNSTDITANTTLNVLNPSGGNSPIVTITLDSATSVSAGHTIKIYLGCSAATSGSCSTQVPTIINPTKNSAAGTSDNWVMQITTRDQSTNTDIDTAKVRIATIDSVAVQANIEPSITFTIVGINNGTAINTSNAGCSNNESTNTSLNSSATNVDLGILTAGGNSIAAQRMTVTTNGANGYALTATSSSHLINDATGYWVTDVSTPATWPGAGTTQFGIHACGADVNTTTWGLASTSIGANTAKVGWPTTGTPLTLASTSNGPIPFPGTSGSGVTSVEYAGTAASTVPPGVYKAVITYVATATF